VGALGEDPRSQALRELECLAEDLASIGSAIAAP
jgi:hypothetical protein